MSEMAARMRYPEAGVAWGGGRLLDFALRHPRINRMQAAQLQLEAE
jgi:hypothetical protein